MESENNTRSTKRPNAAQQKNAMKVFESLFIKASERRLKNRAKKRNRLINELNRYETVIHRTIKQSSRWYWDLLLYYTNLKRKKQKQRFVRALLSVFVDVEYSFINEIPDNKE